MRSIEKYKIIPRVILRLPMRSIGIEDGLGHLITIDAQHQFSYRCAASILKMAYAILTLSMRSIDIEDGIAILLQLMRSINYHIEAQLRYQ